MKKKVLCLLLTGAMTASLFGCGSTGTTAASGDTGAAGAKATEDAASTEAGTAAEEDLSYEYGEHFHSDEPVSYTMFWSDHEMYPVTDTWEIFNKITELTNVTLDYKNYSIARPDYDDKKALMINSGESAYIIPKVYDEAAFVDGGAVVAVSDYVQYMPNYTNFIEKYNLQEEVNTLLKADGKYYRLPGLKETAEQDYTLAVRNDIFKAAGVDCAAEEKDWTWEDFYNDLVKVKEYMVSEGMCKDSDYIWSERWPGDDGSGGNLLKIMGASYGVKSGWAIENALQYDAEKDEWYLVSTTDDYKEYVTMLNKFIKGGLLDPESFTQTDEQACNKFYNGQTVLIGVNKSVITTYQENLNTTIGEGKYELYEIVLPKGSTNYTAENQRLENGVMISSQALEDLGEEDFIKMIRFVDWLFYSDEAYDLTKWGVEGETYEVVDGKKQLLPQWYCGGLSIGQSSDDQKDMRIELGYAGGVFFYGGSYEQATDAYPEEIKDYFDRVSAYRETRPINPPVPADEDENEQLNLYKAPLVDNINTWTLQFITGQKDIEKDWDAYVESCSNLNSQAYVDLYNEIYKASK